MMSFHKGIQGHWCIPIYTCSNKDYPFFPVQGCSIGWVFLCAWQDFIALRPLPQVLSEFDPGPPGSESFCKSLVFILCTFRFLQLLLVRLVHFYMKSPTGKQLFYDAEYGDMSHSFGPFQGNCPVINCVNGSCKVDKNCSCNLLCLNWVKFKNNCSRIGLV